MSQSDAFDIHTLLIMLSTRWCIKNRLAPLKDLGYKTAAKELVHRDHQKPLILKRSAKHVIPVAVAAAAAAAAATGEHASLLCG